MRSASLIGYLISFTQKPFKGHERKMVEAPNKETYK